MPAYHLQTILQLNFLPLMVIIFLFVFLIINNRFEHELTVKFWPMLVMLLALVVFDNIDYFEFDRNNKGFFHVFAAFMGYNLRIFILYRLVVIVMRDMPFKKKKIFMAPAIINLGITFTAFFTKLVFWYGPDGSIMRGPLAYTPHFTLLLYMLICAWLSIIFIRQGNSEEATIVIVESILAILGTFVEFKFGLRGILIGVISMNITFYYLYIHLRYFRYDVLTGAYNRNSFFADAQKYADSITYIYSIDVNNLKKVNDTEGHQAGDKIIRGTALVIRSILPANCYLYRVGGDEFCVLCTDISRENVALFTNRLRQQQQASEFSFAIGFHDWHKDFETTYAEADKAMYADKIRMKAGRTD